MATQTAVSGTKATVQSLRVRAARVPMSQPHRTASGVITESPLVLTDITTSDGVVGHSMVFTYTTAALKPTAELVRNLDPLIQGKAFAPATITDMLTLKFRLLGCEGLIAMAIAAIDMAAWDASARSHGVSLTRLFGAEHRRIPAYGAIGFDGVEGSAATGEYWAKRGFRGVKAKIGYATVQEDREVIRAIRQAIGPDMAIMVDYNQSLTPVEAVQRIRYLEDEGLTWVEEPVAAHDLKGHALVAREVNTPIQAGENWWGPTEMNTAVEEKASDYMMLDAMKIGGVTGWTRAASIAAVNAIPISSHLWPEISAQLLSATPTAHYLEYADWWNSAVSEPLLVENGMAVVPDDVIGSGIEWNEKAISDFAA